MLSAGERRLVAMAFPTRAVGYVTDGAGIVYKTANAGRTWQELLHTEGLWEPALKAISFVDEEYGLLGSRSTLLRTGDGGHSWEQVSSTDQPALAQFLPLEPDAVAAATAREQHWWDQVSEKGQTIVLTALLCISHLVGYATGIGGQLLTTRDGGRRWRPVVTGTLEGLQAMLWPTDETGFAVGNNGIVLRLSGSGPVVELVAALSDQTHLAIAFPSARVGCLVGLDGEIIMTYDGGQTWERKREVGDFRRRLVLSGVAFFDELIGVAVARSGEILRTVDGGQTWDTRVLHEGIGLRAICAPTATTGYVLSNERLLFKTTDAGATFRVLHVPE